MIFIKVAVAFVGKGSLAVGGRPFRAVRAELYCCWAGCGVCTSLTAVDPWLWLRERVKLAELAWAELARTELARAELVRTGQFAGV